MTKRFAHFKNHFTHEHGHICTDAYMHSDKNFPEIVFFAHCYIQTVLCRGLMKKSTIRYTVLVLTRKIWRSVILLVILVQYIRVLSL